MKEYDLVVIGAGPAGEKAAVKAAYFGYRVAIIEAQRVVGGAGVNTGTLPSKTLRETALYYSGKYEKGLYGIDKELQRKSSVKDFMFRKDHVVRECGEDVYNNLAIHKVDIFWGRAEFLDSHTIRISGEKEEKITGCFILIATGSCPSHPEDIPFEDPRVRDSDSILQITCFPKSICVLGAGVIGCEYATIFATMGAHVYLVNRSNQVLPFLDKGIRAELVEEMSKEGVEIVFNSAYKKIHTPENLQEPLKIELETEEILNVDYFLFAAGRCGQIQGLNLEKAKVDIGPRETILVNENYQTSASHIYAAGDVIGFPALASTSTDQGRVAVAHMFDTHDIEELPKVFTYAIYTVPEVAMVGITQEQAEKEGIDCVVGIARYADTHRGRIMGMNQGFLKLVFSKEDLKILGVHIIGYLASELIHYGMLLIQSDKNIMNLISVVFNYPSLHDLYKYAAYDGLGNLSGHKIR